MSRHNRTKITKELFHVIFEIGLTNSGISLKELTSSDIDWSTLSTLT